MEKELQLLSNEEQRVLGVLIEKSKTTPDYYPMTLNALTAGCNQKTSRRPVVDYDESTTMMAVNSLKGQSLVSTAVGAGSRVVKYKHNFFTLYPVNDAELAILCLLFLRGPQTPGELNTNSGRLHEFSGLESVQEALNRLSQMEPPFVKELPRRPGQKETRYAHLFGESQEPDEDQPLTEPAMRPLNAMEERLSLLEKELAEVKETLAKLVKELMG
ncbi:MAG: YceH family protein [Bacteroidota bacterium]